MTQSAASSIYDLFDGVAALMQRFRHVDLSEYDLPVDFIYVNRRQTTFAVDFFLDSITSLAADSFALDVTGVDRPFFAERQPTNRITARVPGREQRFVLDRADLSKPPFLHPVSMVLLLHLLRRKARIYAGELPASELLPFGPGVAEVRRYCAFWEDSLLRKRNVFELLDGKETTLYASKRFS